MVTLDVDLRGFDRMIIDLANAVKKPPKAIIHMESAAILQTVLDRTKTKAASRIRAVVGKKYNTFADGRSGARANGRIPKISVAPMKGNIWWVDHNASGQVTCYVMNGSRRWSDARWAQYQAMESERIAARERAVKEAVGRRGLPKQSWYFLGEIIGAKMKASGYVVRSVVDGRMLREYSIALVKELEGQYALDFRNSYKASFYADGTRLLNAAIQGRIKFFEKNLKLGVFKQLKDVARAYPGLEVRL